MTRWLGIALLCFGLGGAAEARTSLRAPMPVPRPGPAASVPSASLFAAALPATVSTRPAPQPTPARDAPPTSVVPSTLTGPHGWIVADLGTGRVLESHRADLPLAPASVAKIPTALYALAHLGPEHRFETRLLATGPVRDGILRGDLVLEGGGDPELDSDGLARLVGRIAGRMSRVEGALRISQGGWPEIARIDTEQPAKASYNPAVAGLNLNFNRVRLAWSRPRGQFQAALDAHAAQSSPPVRVVSLTLEGDDCRCPAFAHEAGQGDATEHWRIRRSLLQGEGAVWLPVRTPGLYAGDVFREAARAAGIALPAPQIARPGTRGEVLASYSSASVNEITESMLRYSTNLTAEVLGLAATRASGRPAPDLAASAAAMNDWAAGLGGFRPGDPAFRLVNHSGLSAASRVSPERMMALLIGAHRHPTLGPQLRAVLRNHPVPPPEAATPGAKPKPGAKRTGPEAVILAKTGTLNFTRGLAGYITTPSGRELVFAYFANDLARRQAGLDDEAPDPGARAWRNAAITQERALLARWIAAYN